MNDNWYDEHMFEIGAKDYLTDKMKSGLKGNQ